MSSVQFSANKGASSELVGVPDIRRNRPIQQNLLILSALSVLLCVFWLLRHPGRQPQPSELARTDLVLREGRLCKNASAAPFTGWMVEFYENHGLKSRSAISNGLLHGLSEGWHTNGRMQIREEFKMGVSQGLRTKWYPSGAKLSEVPVADGKLHGTFRRWHENGSLAEQVAMQKGQPEGSSWAYYPSGFLKARARMSQGKLVEQKYWADGEVRGGGDMP
jgi:antitoxin component YwqK of YwqJK toxin-antitoxin module